MRHQFFLLALSLQLLLVSSCSSTKLQPKIEYTPASSVTRAETIRIAESYRSMLWQASPEHAFHDKDKDGILVNTPDLDLKKGIADRAGWWTTTGKNQGMPYKWGGFDTPESFHKKLLEGHYAGDVYTSSKRRLLYDGVSRYACGVDCSGFISRCWRLNRAYSTRELASLCDEISYQNLKMGDSLRNFSLRQVIHNRAEGMQESDSWAQKEWPSEEKSSKSLRRVMAAELQEILTE